MSIRKDGNLIIFIDKSYKIISNEKSKDSFQNKEVKIYSNSSKDIVDEKITNKIIKDANNIKGLKYTIIMKLIILMNLFIKTLPILQIHFIDFYFSNITLKLNGTGERKIFCSNTSKFNINYYPNLIYINNILQNSVNYTYNFNETVNDVKLVWNNPITICDFMFDYCPDILEVDLSEFNASNITAMSDMFAYCESITSINFGNINFPKLKTIGAMFKGCSSLKSINLTNFFNIKFISIRFLFKDCSSLISLDLSDFDTTEVTYINNIFDGCTKLEYINMKNFNEIKVSDGYNNYIFRDVPENIVVCINEAINQNIIIPQLKSKKCYNIDCSENWKSKQRTIISNVNGCECELNGCLSCPNLNLSENKKLCKSCNDSFYQIENTFPIGNNYFECYKEPKGYYLDTIASLYKKCFFTCETCDKKGDFWNHNCLTCNDNFTFRINSSNYVNCYSNCNHYNYYVENEHSYYCTNNLSCPNEYPKLIEDKQECVKETINIIKDAISNINKSENGEIKYYDKIIESVEDIFTSNYYDTSDLEKGEDQIIEKEKIIITLTTAKNQKNNINNNMTTIDLEECEDSLRQAYNLSRNETLYIKMLEVSQEGMRISKTEYDIYAKLNGENLTKLNLSYCKNSKISLSIPVGI